VIECLPEGQDCDVLVDQAVKHYQSVAGLLPIAGRLQSAQGQQYVLIRRSSDTRWAK
jgi:hypothetical protein